MSYDHWKTTNPADEELGPEPDNEKTLEEIHEERYAHDAPPDWDGRHDAVEYLSEEECQRVIEQWRGKGK